ncbi:hypothetical protein [Geobacter pickeringii]|uniref:Uncharacterized protein n=1 Tax=Geobacter pickeringii TaxID=345632 RepID=A0A0B5BC67_9BACT|nr:hypothetical protein [Geobacter pickeringii]AJE02639.1 hypothetical protein GPICK_03970 [Geobacter pickeringii]
MNLTKYVLTVATIALSAFCGVAVSLAQQAEKANVLTVAHGAEIRFASPWKLSAVQYSNAQELVVMGTAPLKAVEKKIEGITEYPVARLLITEARSDHGDALKRLESIAESRDVPAEFVEVGGWPAVEVTFTEKLPRRGAPGEDEEEASAPEVTVQRTVTAIAQGDKVVIFDSSVLQEAPQDLMKGAKEITRSVRFARRGEPAEIRKALESLQSTEKKRQLLFKKPESSAPEPGAAAASAVAAAVGAPVQVQTGVGELEIAASADASTVVIASNSGLSFSTNRGTSFAAGTTGVFGLNDPSLARGASSNYYLGVIAIPTGTPAQLNVSGCTNAVSRSTNNGAAFTLQGYSATCPTTGAGVCFPDQEHIAGDGRNAAAGGDMLYAV